MENKTSKLEQAIVNQKIVLAANKTKPEGIYIDLKYFRENGLLTELNNKIKSSK